MSLNILNVIAGACLFVVLFSGLMLVRNQLVFKIRNRRIDELHDTAMELIERGQYDRARSIQRIDPPTYDQMLWQLTKWRYADFYQSKEQT